MHQTLNSIRDNVDPQNIKNLKRRRPLEDLSGFVAAEQDEQFYVRKQENLASRDLAPLDNENCNNAVDILGNPISRISPDSRNYVSTAMSSYSSSNQNPSNTNGRSVDYCVCPSIDSNRSRKLLAHTTSSESPDLVLSDDELVFSSPLLRGRYSLSPNPRQRKSRSIVKIVKVKDSKTQHEVQPVQQHNITTTTPGMTEESNKDTCIIPSEKSINLIPRINEGDHYCSSISGSLRRRIFSDLSEDSRPHFNKTETRMESLRNGSRAPIVIARVRNQFRRLYIRSRIPHIQLLPRLRRRIRYTRFASNQHHQRWLIPSQHPMKVLWDFLTVLISLTNAYATHVAIADRSIGNSHSWQYFCQIWFVVDILLNFVTEHKLSMNGSSSFSSLSSAENTASKEGDDIVLTNCQAVWARYLTSWFVVDLLSLVPGEALFVKPIIEQQKKRGFIKRNLFRIRAIIRFIRRGFLQRKHITMFSTVAKHSKRAGMGGASHLLRVMIKYIPKYVLFLRKMKGLLALRVLRQFHWFHKVWQSLGSIIKSYYQYSPRRQAINSLWSTHKNRHDDETISLTCEEDDDGYCMGDNDEFGHNDHLAMQSFSTHDSHDRFPSASSSYTSQDCQVFLVGPDDSWEILEDGEDCDEMNNDDYDSDGECGYPY